MLIALGEVFDQFLAFPLSGPARGGLRPGLRAAFHGRYVIYYHPTDDALTIMRIIHGARDSAALDFSSGDL
jgi:toxin ParE1/3/4